MDKQKASTPHIGNCQTPDELAKVIEYHLKQGGMRRDIYNSTGLIRIEYDDFETHRLYGIALNNYNDIRKSYPELPHIQIATSDLLSGLAQIQQLCAASGKAGETSGGKIGSRNTDSQDKHEDIVELKPNFCGIGLNINALIRKKQLGIKVKNLLKVFNYRKWWPK